MAKQVTKRCHWVSQSYLKAFAADEAGQKIWRFSKNDGDPELKPIENVAVRFYLYAPMAADGTRNDPVERKLSELEQWFGEPIWKALCTSELDLTWEPLRKMLALIVATTYVRNPVQFETWKRIHRQMVEQVSGLESMPTRVTIGGVEHQVDASDWPDFRDAGEEPMKAAWNDYIAGAGDIAPRLLGMRMVMVAAKKPVFITSDNPVTITHPSLEFRGIRDPETTITTTTIAVFAQRCAASARMTVANRSRRYSRSARGSSRSCVTNTRARSHWRSSARNSLKPSRCPSNGRMVGFLMISTQSPA